MIPSAVRAAPPPPPAHKCHTAMLYTICLTVSLEANNNVKLHATIEAKHPATLHPTGEILLGAPPKGRIEPIAGHHTCPVGHTACETVMLHDRTYYAAQYWYKSSSGRHTKQIEVTENAPR
jgi:hypothetical protein